MIVKAPNPTNRPESLIAPSVFLAGSIEMGKAEHWQKELGGFLSHLGFFVMDPRRDDWDSSWVQNINNPQFSQQVNWELENIDGADIILFYFDPNTQSPITLMELGYCIGAFPHRVTVICPEGYFRKGNVDIICNKNGIVQFSNIENFMIYMMKFGENIRDKIQNHK